MKLVFKKDKEHQIIVLNEVEGKQSDFSYVDMIKELIKSKKLEEPDISEDFSEAEIKSIGSMISHINKNVSETEKPEGGKEEIGEDDIPF